MTVFKSMDRDLEKKLTAFILKIIRPIQNPIWILLFFFLNQDNPDILIWKILHRGFTVF
jgi:hypothetical protein